MRWWLCGFVVGLVVGGLVVAALEEEERIAEEMEAMR